MPNWCYNSLIVSGNKETLADFVSKTIIPTDKNDDWEDERGKFTFNILHPLPKPLEGGFSPLPRKEGEDDTQYKERIAENIRLYGAEDWYEWNIQNWGTKWNASSTSIQILEDDLFHVRFNTAWSPPIEWIKKIVPMYPELEFELTFDEESYAFCGKISAIEGEIDMEVGEPYFTDEQDNKVIYDSEKHLWKYEDTGILIEDEDFYPIDVNPFA